MIENSGRASAQAESLGSPGGTTAETRNLGSDGHTEEGCRVYNFFEMDHRPCIEAVRASIQHQEEDWSECNRRSVVSAGRAVNTVPLVLPAQEKGRRIVYG